MNVKATHTLWYKRIYSLLPELADQLAFSKLKVNLSLLQSKLARERLDTQELRYTSFTRKIKFKSLHQNYDFHAQEQSQITS